MGIQWLWLCNTSSWLGWTPFASILFPVFLVRVYGKRFPRRITGEGAAATSLCLCARLGQALCLAVCGRLCCCGAAVGPATVSPSPGSSCSFSHSWARGVQLRDKGHQWAPPGGHSLHQVGGCENGQEFKSIPMGLQLVLAPPLSFLSIFSSPLPALQISSSTNMKTTFQRLLNQLPYLSKVKAF